MYHLIQSTDFQLQHDAALMPGEGDYLFVYRDQQFLFLPEQGLPEWSVNIQYKQKPYFFGTINQKRCFMLDTEDLPLGKFTDAKTSYNVLPVEQYQAVAFGHHLHHWRQKHRFCGQCGHLMEDKADERARVCPSCGQVVYPRISPCVIMLITRGEEILLARSTYFKSTMFSTLAGFMEPGETAEQAVKREVYEEVGLSIKNIRYVASQPWPFPDLLMLGFHADYDSGDLVLQPSEIAEARWFTKKDLSSSNLPSQHSIARYLIDEHYQSTLT